MKSKYDDYETDHTDAVYSENKIELLWLIETSLVYDKKPNRTTTWLIV